MSELFSKSNETSSRLYTVKEDEIKIGKRSLTLTKIALPTMLEYKE